MGLFRASDQMAQGMQSYTIAASLQRMCTFQVAEKLMACNGSRRERLGFYIEADEQISLKVSKM